MKVFVVLEDSAYDYDQYTKIFVFDSKEKAIAKKNELIERSGIRDEIDERYICNENETYFDAYLDGEYVVNHYVVSIDELEVQ